MPCRTPTCLDSDASPGAPFRRSVRDSAGDDDRYPADSARAAQREDWPDGKGPAVGDNRSTARTWLNEAVEAASEGVKIFNPGDAAYFPP